MKKRLISESRSPITSIRFHFLKRFYGSLILLFLCPIFLAFDSFNIVSDFDIEKIIKCINVLKEFYGQPQQSTFNNETNVTNPVIDKTELNDDTIRSCLTDFHAEVNGKLNYATGRFVNLFKKRTSN